MIDESVKCEIINLQDELITLKYFIDKINNIVRIINNNHNINVKINNLEKISLVLNKKKKSELSKLKSEIIVLDLPLLKKELKKEFKEKMITKHEEYNGVDVLFDTMSLGNILMMLEDIYKRKSKIYMSKLNEYFPIEENKCLIKKAC